MPDDMPTTRTDNGEPVKYVPITEFWAKGYVQEINRRFLHPLGMALEVAEDKDGVPRLGGIQDYRADPEGMLFGELLVVEDTIRALLINEEWDARKATRVAALGWMIEPLPNAAEELADTRASSQA